MELTRGTATVQGIRTSFLRGGHGTSIVFLHGWGARADHYRPTLEALPEDTFEGIVPDLPGFGDTPPPPPSWGLEDYVHWVEEFLATLGRERVVVVGHSFGGRIAILLGAKRSPRVHAILLYAAAGVTPRKHLKRLVFRMVAHVGKAFFHLPLLRALSTHARLLLYHLAGAWDYARAGRLQPIFLRVIERDLTAEVSRIGIPTGLLWGALDSVTPVSDARAIHVLLPHARLRILPDAGHIMHREQPAVFGREVVFLVRALTTT